MPISQVFLDNGEYLLVSVAGTCSRAELLTAISQLVAHCQQHEIKRLIWDIRRMQGNLGLMDWYDLARPDGLRKVWVHRLALVSGPDMTDATFGENVAANRGLTLKVFGDLDGAEGWLLKEEG